MRTAALARIRSLGAMWLAVCSMVLALCGQARALIPAVEPCVELQASLADCVVAGVVEKEEAIAGPPGSTLWTQLTVRTTERLLGDPGDEFTCAMPNDSYGFADQATAGDERLFLLAKGTRYAVPSSGAAAAWFRDVPWTTLAKWDQRPLDECTPPFPLTPPGIATIETMKLAAFGSRQEVLDAVRKYCVRPMPPLPVEHMRNPHPAWSDPANGLKWCGIIRIPLDGAAETLAQTWIDSPNDMLRSNAVRILRHDHTATNVALFTTLARQPTNTKAQDVARTMALSTLVDWHEKVDWTRNHAAAVPNGPATLNFWLCAALAPVASMLYWMRSPRRGWWRTAVAVWLCALSVLAIVGIRSIVPMDGFESGTWKGCALRGDLFLVKVMRPDAPHRSPCSLENPRNVPDLMEPPCPFYHADWSFDWRSPSLSFVKSFGFERDASTYPAWSAGCTYRLPLWLPTGLLLLLVPAIRIVRSFRRLRAQRARGFPVLIDDGKG